MAGMIIEFNPTGERAREYAALSSDIMSLISAGLLPIIGASKPEETGDAIRIFGDKNLPKNREPLVDGMRTNYFVEFMYDGQNRFGLRVNHSACSNHQSAPVLEENVTYVFERTQQGLKTWKESYYRDGPELIRHTQDSKLPEVEANNALSVSRIEPPLGLSLEELRLVHQICAHPLNWAFLLEVPMPSSEFGLLTENFNEELVVLDDHRAIG